MEFLGFTKDEWEIINGFANWLAAFGTIAAVCLSLKLAREAGQARAKCSAGPRLIVSTAPGRAQEEVVQLRVVNVGEKPITVTHVGWRAGYWSKKHFAQFFDNQQSTPLPHQLHHGDQGTWLVPAELEEGWYTRFATVLIDEGEPWLRSLRFVASTSTDQTFVCKPDAALIGKIARAIIEVKRQRRSQANPAL